MKSKKNLNYKIYYVFGAIICFVFLFLFALFVTLPLIFSDFPSYMGRVSIVICVLSFLGIIFGVYLLKKGNFLKLNEKNLNQDELIKEKIKEKYQNRHNNDSE